MLVIARRFMGENFDNFPVVGGVVNEHAFIKSRLAPAGFVLLVLAPIVEGNDMDAHDNLLSQLKACRSIRR